jgi:TDG/mug DNA glycosylase family protein
MMDSVPSLLAKVVRCRPRIVCFVGMGIWRIVEKVLVKSASMNEGDRELKMSSPSKGKPKKSTLNDTGLQPYKFVYNIGHSEEIGKYLNIIGLDAASSHSAVDQKFSVHETFIFVVPSTSGRVVSHQVRRTCSWEYRSIGTFLQLPDKVKLFGGLKAAVEDYKQSRINSSQMSIITLPIGIASAR